MSITFENVNKSLSKNDGIGIIFDSLKICNIDSVKHSIFEEICKMEIEHERIKNEIAIEESQCVNITARQVKFYFGTIKTWKPQ